MYVQIAEYSYITKRFSPNTICASCEFSFTSSILTYYCEMYNVKHINIMYGEMIYDMRNAFSRFSVFYVWNMYYRELLMNVRCSTQVYRENAISIPERTVNNVRCVKYYSQVQSKRELLKIKEILDYTFENYKIRWHPGYQTSKCVLEVFDDSVVENPKEIDLWESLFEADVVIAQTSFVLYQAYSAGIPVIIDDISNPILFEKFKTRGYYLTAIGCNLLSDIIN